MRIVFMGTPDFAVPSLEKLIEENFDVAAVFTQPDKPVGRKGVLTAPPVKTTALRHNIEVFQPQSLKDDSVYDLILSLKPELIAVVAYGKILPKRILEIPPKGCINVHGSLLPKYRGAAPIQRSILNGEETTGVTTMYMGEGLDTGDILLKEETPIGENETAQELFERLSVMGARLLVDTIDNLDTITVQKQDDSLATYAHMIDRSLCPIDWNKSAREIHNKVRALSGWPVAQTTFNGKRLKIHSGHIGEKTSADAGEIIDNNKCIKVACGDGMSYVIDSLQLDGKKRMNSDVFLLGNNIKIGERFC